MEEPPKKREPMTGWKLAGTIVGLVIGGLIGLLGSPQWAIFPVSNTYDPPDSIDLAVAVICLSMLFWIGGIFSRRELAAKSSAQDRERPPLRRPSAKTGSRCLRYQLVMVLALWVLYPTSWTFSSVGVRQEFPIADFFFGVFAYGVLILLLHLIFRMGGVHDSQADNTMINMAALWPREPRQKLAMWIGVCILNPITEELLFRGILVYQLGEAIGNTELAVLLGFFVTLANHAYQGSRSVLLHSLYYVFAIGLLFSPMGIMGAIGMHFAGDIVPVSLIKRNLKSYRVRHRREAKKIDDGLPVPEIEWASRKR
jgi:membrane protease YdiL (CAAX protease family)